MRMRLLFPGLVLAVAALPGPATASHDPSGAPFDQDFVVGNAEFPSGSPNPNDPIHISIDAHSGAQGQNPAGFASISIRQSFLGGPVTCLRVEGNRATVAGGGPILPAPYVFVVEDNAGTGRPDLFGAADLSGLPPIDCSTDVPPVFPGTPITSGDLVVHDALGFPSSKDQCKNGGWRHYPGFKNQGQCVSFVATSPKRPV